MTIQCTFCTQLDRSSYYTRCLSLTLRHQSPLACAAASVGGDLAPWPRGRGFEPHPSTVRAPTGWHVFVSIAIPHAHDAGSYYSPISLIWPRARILEGNV
ncbi:hypothetical protein ElyMa_001036000 [Elysia marginata]|uniref:Uncharacterized protein n=1 Tax=Elysia marginata TaxID=1093978 RepID=A0AAV4HMH8_9GAST|nr:hypothetical protein ElyMa_001036000 [Elysia marginata]